MADIPRDPSFDASLAFLREGYPFVSNRCERLDSDVFRTRIMLRPAYCARGAEAAEIFYGGDRFTRVGAMPRSVLLLLQDKGSVQTLDAGAHRHRKAMFVALLSGEAVDRLAEIFERHWLEAVEAWSRRDRVVLQDGVRIVLTRAVCEWAGVPLDGRDTAEIARELSEMIDRSGTVGPLNWRARALRRRTERWVGGLIERTRAGSLSPPPGSALRAIATHEDPDGSLLSVPVATVELINILRPVVAVARFITFAALALHEHPDARESLLPGDDGRLEAFVQEVRRFYPFFPVVGGKVRQTFEWRGHRFREGEWMVLDLYGTNHDPALWPEPGRFRPERFEGWTGTGYDLVPQGAGEVAHGHRCPGEWITIALVKSATRLLATRMRYEVPQQDLSIDLTQFPARPRSGFVISRVARAD